MSWIAQSMDEIVTFQRGFDLPKTKFIAGSYPVAGSTAVMGYHNEYKVEAPCLITGRSGTLGRFQFLDQPCWPHNTTLWVKDFKGNHPRFLYYLFQGLDFSKFNSGASVPTLNRNVLKSMQVKLPSNINTQHRIASILSAYDDLIENNLKRIKLLEEAAQNIYREWFVEMRFPGYETVNWTEDEQGRKLPEGWEYVPLIDVCELTMGQSPKSEFYNNNNDGLPFHQGVTGYGFRYVVDSKYCTMPTRIANEGDILCSVRAPVGRLNITMNKIIIGRGLSAIRNRQGFQSFQFYQLKSHFYQEDMIGGGAIFNSVTKKVLSKQTLLRPSQELLISFEKVGKQIDEQIQNLSIQNQVLREARDILLPRLMNQTIEV